MDDFGVEYFGKQHADHLATILKKYHKITEEWEGKKYAGIYLKWNYNKRTCRATMDGYMLDIRKKYGHPTPKKPQYSPHKHRTINYGAKQHMVQPEDTIPSLDDKEIKRVQGIVGSLLYVGRALNNKLIVSLSAIGSQKAASTVETSEAIEQLLNYVATYPDNGIIFLASDMILAAHADAGFLKKIQSP